MDEIDFVESPDPRAIKELEDHLHEFNVGATGHGGGVELAAFVRDGQRLIGGIFGWIWGQSSEISLLWVAEGHRHSNLGSRLLTEFEEQARTRGAKNSALSTGSFQAPDFYKRHGYEVVAELRDHPAGFSEFILRKTL